MDDEKVKARVKRARNVKTFAELSNANWVLLENINDKRDGWFYECMTAILMAAFKFESYLNHLGNILFPYWAEMERLPHKAKLNIIRSHLNLGKSYGGRPYQTLNDLFIFRDSIAHGKTEYLDPPESVEVGNMEEIRRRKPLTRWEKLCTTDFAKRAYEDTDTIIKQLHATAGQDIKNLRSSGYSYTIKEVENTD